MEKLCGTWVQDHVQTFTSKRVGGKKEEVIQRRVIQSIIGKSKNDTFSFV